MFFTQGKSVLSRPVSVALTYVKNFQFSNIQTLEGFLDRFRSLKFEENTNEVTYSQFQDEITRSCKNWDFNTINYNQIQALSILLRRYKAHNVPILFALQKQFVKTLPDKNPQSFSDALATVQLLSPDNIAETSFLQKSYEHLVEKYQQDPNKNERKLGNFSWTYAYFNLPDPKITEFFVEALNELFPTLNTINPRIEAIYLAKIAFYLSYDYKPAHVMHEKLLSRIEKQIEHDRVKFYRSLNTKEYLGFVWTWIHSLELYDRELYLRYKEGVCKKIPFQLYPANLNKSRQKEFGDFLSGFLKNIKLKHEEQLGVYRADFYIEDQKAVIEYNGKNHYINFSERETGRHLIRARNLRDAGYKLVDIPYYEWNGLTTVEQKHEYLRKKFKEANVDI